MERPTRLELATSTLARWRSTRGATAAHSICLYRAFVRRRWLLYRTLRQLSTTNLHFFKKECLFALIRSFLFCVRRWLRPFHPILHGYVYEQNTVAFYFTNYYNKEDALSNGKCIRTGAASIYRKEKGIASKKELTQCIRSLKRSR